MAPKKIVIAPAKKSKRKMLDSPTADKNEIKYTTGTLVRESMKEYGHYVIENRAIPDFRDGMKPVQRRALYAMKDIGISHTGGTFKCARIVGDIIGKYNPHGDTAAYGALVGLKHLRYPLVHSDSNFGDELNTPGAMRYTEAKFTDLQVPIFACLNVAEMVPNYDGTLREPLVINTRLPLLLMNGTEGIAVGVATNIPSHNLGELLDALIHVAKNKNATIEEVMQFVKGPDFRRGGIIVSPKKEILEVYRNGFGALDFQCEYETSKDEDGRMTIKVVGYPDAFSIPAFINACNKMQQTGDVAYVTTDYEKLRFTDHYAKKDNKDLITITVGINNKKALNAITKKLSCRSTYKFYTTKREEDGISLKSYNFLDTLRQWIKWRKSEEGKLLELELSKQKKLLWNEETRLIAMQPKHIDIIAEGLKQTKLEFEAYIEKHLKITPEQASFIADLKVGTLRKSSIPEQEKKIKDIKSVIAKINDDLAHLTRVVVERLKDMKSFADERRTKLSSRGQKIETLKIERTGDPLVFLAGKDGKLFGNVSEKGSTIADVIATASYDGAAVVDSGNGLTNIMSTSEFVGKAGPAYKDIVGIVPLEAKWIIAVGKNGNVIKTQGPEEQSKKEFMLMKSVVMFAGGAYDDSMLLVWGKKSGEYATIKVSKIAEMRKNTAGTKLVKFKPVRVLLVHPGQSVYTDEGTRIYASNGDTVGDKVKLFVLDNKNIVIYKSGRRKFMDMKSTVKEMAKDSSGVRFVYPICVNDNKQSTEG